MPSIRFTGAVMALVAVATGLPGRPRRLSRRWRLVVDDDDGAFYERCGALDIADGGECPGDLLAFVSFDGVHRLCGDGGQVDDVRIGDFDAVLADRTHGQFAAAGDTEFADRENVEWCVQHTRDLRRHGYATAWQAEHDDHVVAVQVAQVLS